MLRVSAAAFCCLLSVSAANALEDACSVPGQTFASCSAQNRNFNSVVLAIPGWHGTCSDTFGQGQDSLFAVMKESGGDHSFFDVDCFEYDTDNVTLPENEKLLRTHLQQLRDDGYDNVMLVTHSTGGVLALRLLLDDMMAPDGKSLAPASSPVFEGERGLVTAVEAWAAPVNGLRGQISLGGKIINIFGLSPAVLPDLDPNSAYLTKLRTDLAQFYSLYNQEPGTERAPFDFKLALFQGQDDDWVVENVPTDAAWLHIVPGQAKIVPTQMGHTNSISVDGTAGTLGAAMFPAELMKDKAHFYLSLSPRFSDLFGSATNTIPAQLADRQLRTVDGVMSYLDAEFLDGITAAAQFFRIVLEDHFGRSDKLDAKVSGDLRTLVETKVTEATPQERWLILQDVLQQIAGLYDPSQPPSVQAFGQGKSAAAKAMLDLVQFIFDKGNEVAAEHPDVVAGSGISLDSFNGKAAAIQARYLAAPTDEVATAAEDDIRLNIPKLSVAAIDSSGIVGAVNAHALAMYRLANPQRQQTIGDTLVALTAASPSAGDAVFASLGVTVDTPQGPQPLWSRVFDNSQVVSVAQFNGPVTEGRFEFLTDVIRHAGATGNAIDTAKIAIIAAADAATKQAIAQPDWSIKLINAGEAAPDPRITTFARDAIAAMPK